MRQRKKKLKVVTKNKSYDLCDSPFYKLKTKRKLSGLLFSDLPCLKGLTDDSLYRCFVKFEKGKGRDVQQPLGERDRIHTRVASLLSRIAPPNFLHSGLKGRSYITNARQHLGKHRVITVDVRSFYPSTKRSQVFDFFFDTLKCSPDVADLLSKVLTYKNQIPTGSRVSMPLAFLSNRKMFLEMAATAEAHGAIMTLYVDDLTFSGTKLNQSFIAKIERIAIKYGHALHPQKTRLFNAMDAKIITGTVVKGTSLMIRNAHLKSLHDNFELWKAKPSGADKVTLSNKILGTMNAMSSIDRRFKNKARSFRSVI